MENKNIELVSNDERKVIKCLKSYLTGKKYYDTDIDKSYEYFKQCIRILNDLKEKNINIKKDFIDIIDETETECSKYLTLAIEATIEKPISKYVNTKPDNTELFEIIETGNIEKLKQFKYGEVNFNVYNENGLTPLHMAIKFGDTTFLKHSFKLGACIDKTNKSGHTLLEFACLEKDPNMINFLLNCGADMKKHLLFREGKKYFNNGDQIDIVLLEKIIVDSSNKKQHQIKYLQFIFEYFDSNELINLEYSEPTNSTVSKGKITMSDFINSLDMLIDGFHIDKRNTYIEILKEELKYDLSFKLGCPTNKIEIILYNLVPFINFEENLKLNWLISLEVKYIILKILKNKVKINTKQLKKELTELLYLSYIKPEIIQEGLLQTIVLQWIYKIKV